MEQESRYSGIVDPEGMVRGRHRHHGHHCLWNEPCNDPRILMYIDDKGCTQNNAAMGDRGHDGMGVRREDEAGDKIEEAENVEQGRRQGNEENAAQYQGWQQANAEYAAQYQRWQQGNQENAGQYQGWQQGSQETAAQYQGWQQGSQETAAQYQGWQQGYQDYEAQPRCYGNHGRRGCPEEQFHVHEIQGAVEVAGRDPHTHRFAAISGEARPWGPVNHYHDVRFRTDFYDDHFHEAWGRTGGAIQVGDRHVHFLESVTTQNDGHVHRFRVGSMIEDPTGD